MSTKKRTGASGSEAPKKSYKVIAAVKTGGKLYRPGSVIEADQFEAGDAERLVKDGWLEVYDGK